MSFADDRIEPDDGGEVYEVRRRLQQIARAEITRHRRRLGPLTREQQCAIEELLMSTADQISGRLIQHLQKCPNDRRAKYLNLWDSHLAA